MDRFFFAAITLVIITGFFSSQAQHGFAVWTEGSNCEGELKLCKLEHGNKGEKQTAVNKGEGADIEVVISYDGVWIAFARFIGRPGGLYEGPCDYHSFDKTDIYVAKIDHGTNLPAEPVKVAHGYWPSWASDATSNDPTKPKTLYYTRYTDQTIRIAVINPDGTIASKDELHATCPVKKTGTNAHTQQSPDGRYIALRPTGMAIYDMQNGGKQISGAGGAGCHPCWGPRSKYLIWSRNSVCRIDDGKTTMTDTSAGLSAYYFGISNDAEYDIGKVWIIGQISSSGSNNTKQIEFKPVDISGGGWKVGTGTKLGSGSWCDIHITTPVGISPTQNKTNHYRGSPFDSKVITSTNGLQLVIESTNIFNYTAELFDMRGIRKAFIRSSGSQLNTLPVNSIANGWYVLQVHTGTISIQKTIWIAK